jgi:hypothetical protein
MRKNIVSKIILLLAIVIVSNNVIAQKKPKTVAFKPPVVTSSMAGFQGTKDSVTIATLQKVIDSSIRIVDAKGVTYTITHYQFVFKKVGVVENDSTGQVTPVSDLSAGQFSKTPLPDVWRKTIKETAVAGDEIYFTDIIASDDKGHVFYAPEIRIGINK